MKPGIAIEDNSAAHFLDGVLHTIITEISGKKAFQIKPDGQHELKTEYIGKI